MADSPKRYARSLALATDRCDICVSEKSLFEAKSNGGMTCLAPIHLDKCTSQQKAESIPSRAMNCDRLRKNPLAHKSVHDVSSPSNETEISHGRVSWQTR